MPLLQDRTNQPGILRPQNPPGEADGRESLRVMHVVSSLAVGGMEQFVLRLAQRQSAEGCPVAIIGLKGGPLAERARELGLTTLALSGGRLSRYAGTAREILRFRPQVVNAHNPAALPYALLARLLCRSGVVMTRHGQEQINPLPSSKLLGRTDSVIAVSE